MTKKNIAVIPARGSSKRIPKKNIKNFLGKPIIAYSIEAAISTNLFDKVIVSTDSYEIAKVAVKYGAETPFIRPKELSDDFTGTDEVIAHTVRWLEDRGERLDYVCCIYPTAPLIQKKDLLNGFDIIKKGKWEIIFAATNFSYPIFRSFKKSKKVGLEMIFPKHYNTRSQDLPKVYHDAGLFYWAKPQIWKKMSKEYNQKKFIVEIPNYRVQDIDTVDDWKRAEIIYQILKKNNY